ncbi:hypothetical protein [Pseudooctadecabacter jejudonensis]|uniref:Lipoprotein n=1 Tax=Pseudooctadecabacter jejudonensis TaxID=1391910 RepID=A0A1Y5T8X6_9RHOB|nr:hypothetical protein [Pseudooctadecabacter jejudonensis]SLN58414.1 hypothetical protein PSJ8397_03074 [Pseudooctadecabacter jejudonensis]
MRLPLIALTALAACEAAPVAEGAARYDGIETRLLDGDLVNFRVKMANVADEEEVADYAACAAAQYALIRGYGFARNVRTIVNEEGGIWTGDAVYTISPALPRGLRTIDAEVTVADCAARDIPTV